MSYECRGESTDRSSRAEIPLEEVGTYRSERQWGTVREDYSHNGDAWDLFTHVKRGHGHTGGGRMGRGFAMTSNSCVLPWRCGMGVMRS